MHDAPTSDLSDMMVIVDDWIPTTISQSHFIGVMFGEIVGHLRGVCVYSLHGQLGCLPKMAFMTQDVVSF